MNCFEIRNIKCTYDKDRLNPKVVLSIEELDIPTGKVVFIVGKSGCGKSTILETLGLMNNTLVESGDSRLVFRPNEDETFDFTNIWRKRDRSISDIRCKYFSFIFQQTNLMKNFTIEENSMLPKLIKGGSRKYHDTLIQIGLGQVISENKQKPEELSGGQQQRLAFVRAILPNYKVLFGDEPTGNLDSDNAENLIKIIDEEIHNDSSKTAIIVSHSIELAEKYADVIIKIHKRTSHEYGQNKEFDSVKMYGEINSESVFVKEKNVWEHLGNLLSKHELHTLLKA